MGLTEKIITPTTMINDTGSIQIADRTIRNWDGEGMGTGTVSGCYKIFYQYGYGTLGDAAGAHSG